MTDKEIVQSLRDPSKRRQAFSGIVSQYSEQLYWRIRRIVGSHDDADDVLQNVFLKAWTRLDNFRGDSNVYTWLYRICVNESLDFLRRRKDFLSTDGTLQIADTQFAEEYFDGDETQRKLQQAIETLPEAQRVTFCMRYFDDMPYSEISAVLGTSEGGLKANYHLAVRKIKEFFDSSN